MMRTILCDDLARPGTDRVFALLRRLQPRFEVVKAVRFAHVGDGFGARAAPQEQP